MTTTDTLPLALAAVTHTLRTVTPDAPLTAGDLEEIAFTEAWKLDDPEAGIYGHDLARAVLEALPPLAAGISRHRYAVMAAGVPDCLIASPPLHLDWSAA
ncbi:hypothetical protein ACPCSP_25585 [Streptomyces cinereoruber]|uniref:hypothetical protein n=1 Tax=Streptomyces cinereoruber TaxID=67260 RepID=UPI003C2B8ADB